MLKHRIIPSLLWNEGALVKGTAFNAWRTVGTVLPAVRIQSLRDVDELLLLDIKANFNRASLTLSELESVAECCRVPLTVGGGITNASQALDILRAGADKVLVNSAAYENPSLISKIADTAGCQAVVVSIDIQSSPNGDLCCMKRCGTAVTGKTLHEWCREIQDRGAGEIMIQSISRDGTMSGYDLDMVKSISPELKVPLIVSGGCSSYENMRQAFECGASAVAVSALFLFTEATPAKAKAYLAAHGIAVRK